MSIELFKKYHETKNTSLRNRLVVLNKGLAYRAAHSAKMYCDESFEDLSQEAFIGLIRAVEDFDPYKGVMFSSYAVPRISGKILQYLRDRSKLIRLTQSMQKMIADIKKLSRQPTTVDEVCKQLNITHEDYELAIGAYKATNRCISIDVEEDDKKPLELVSSEENLIEETNLVFVKWDNATEKEMEILKTGGIDIRNIWKVANNWISSN